MEKVKSNEKLPQPNWNDRLFGVYSNDGWLRSVHGSPTKAFEVATKMNKYVKSDGYFIDWIIIN